MQYGLGALQGGRQAAVSFTRKHMLSGQTLEMLGDMRGQFASMLADIGFVRAPGRGGPRGYKGSAAWVDDRKAAWNQHSAQPAVVCHTLLLQCHISTAYMWHGPVCLTQSQPMAALPYSITHVQYASSGITQSLCPNCAAHRWQYILSPSGYRGSGSALDDTSHKLCDPALTSA